MTHKILVSSGRFSKSAKTVEYDMHRWLMDTSVSVLMLTEFSNNRRKAVIKSLPNWDLYNGIEKPGGDDALIAWKNSNWTYVKSTTLVLSRRKSYRANKKLIPPQRAIFVLLKDVQGNNYLFTQAHLSSHIETSRGLRRNLRRLVWLQSIHTWSRQITKLEREWKPTHTIINADFNVNWKRLWVRKLLHSVFPRRHSVWVKPFPRIGDLGYRIITIPLLSRNLKSYSPPKYLPTTSSDHRAFTFSVRS